MPLHGGRREPISAEALRGAPPPASALRPTRAHPRGEWVGDKVTLGAHHHATRTLLGTLRPQNNARTRVRRSASAPRTGRERHGVESVGRAEKAEDRDADWRCGQQSYCESHFYSSLRSWNGLTDVRDTTPADWRVSTADTLRMGDQGGHDMSSNDAQGWRSASSVYVGKQFQSGLRDYEGVDIAASDDPAAPKKKHSGIARESSPDHRRLTSTNADRYFFASLRDHPAKGEAPIDPFFQGSAAAMAAMRESRREERRNDKGKPKGEVRL